MHDTALDVKNLITGAPVKTGHLLSAKQTDDLKQSTQVEQKYLDAREEAVSGTIKEEISGVRGIAFLVNHHDTDGRLNGTVGAYFACELFPPF